MRSDCAEAPPRAPAPAWPLEERRAGTGRRRLVSHGRERPAQDEPIEVSARGAPAVQAPRRWGRSAEAVAHRGDRLAPCWLRLRGCLTTRTRDPRAHASAARRAPLTMAPARNCANLDRPVHGGEGQALQHVRSNAPWSGPAGLDQRQAESQAPPALAPGSTLMLAESAEEKAGTHHVGAARQDKGRRGQVDVCRVETCLSSANGGGGTRVEGELCLPEAWCGDAVAPRRTEWGIPPERRGATQRALGLTRVKRGQAQGVPCAL